MLWNVPERKRDVLMCPWIHTVASTIVKIV